MWYFLKTDTLGTLVGLMMLATGIVAFFFVAHILKQLKENYELVLLIIAIILIVWVCYGVYNVKK